MSSCCRYTFGEALSPFIHSFGSQKALRRQEEETLTLSAWPTMPMLLKHNQLRSIDSVLQLPSVKEISHFIMSHLLPHLVQLSSETLHHLCQLSILLP